MVVGFRLDCAWRAIIAAQHFLRYHLAHAWQPQALFVSSTRLKGGFTAPQRELRGFFWRTGAAPGQLTRSAVVQSHAGQCGSIP
ncbi:MAG: hypothetical protein EBZ60_07595 [Betaproteobacteria bacterium]|nr:hypothetical protein [Betaproteobacteria bacterium]